MNYHFQGKIGYSFVLSENVSLKTFGGYFYSNATLKVAEDYGFFGSNYINYKGNYQSLFGQFQLTAKRKKSIWGVNLKIGQFTI